MERLAQLAHDVVGNINDVGNGVVADQGKASSHPCRGLSQLYIVYIVGNIARAEILCIYGDLKVLFFYLSLGIVQSWSLQWLAQCCCHLSCQTEDALAVRTVCRNGNIEDPVV